MKRCFLLILVAVVLLSTGSLCRAGMPALLPTSWTAGKRPPDWARVAHSSDAAPWQAISFFGMCLLVSAFGVQGLWNSLRGTFPRLPPLSYARSLSLVILWGLCFVVVLTMISGARELMTPGAWKKQGWTYTLTDATPATTAERRREALEQLRNALWHFAATHAGKFPAESDTAIGQKLWEIPELGGLRFLYVSDRSVEETGRLLAFEPEIDSSERHVLLTNGFLGTMQTAEIERQLQGATKP